MVVSLDNAELVNVLVIQAHLCRYVLYSISKNQFLAFQGGMSSTDIFSFLGWIFLNESSHGGIRHAQGVPQTLPIIAD